MQFGANLIEVMYVPLSTQNCEQIDRIGENGNINENS